MTNQANEGKEKAMPKLKVTFELDFVQWRELSFLLDGIVSFAAENEPGPFNETANNVATSLIKEAYVKDDAECTLVAIEENIDFLNVTRSICSQLQVYGNTAYELRQQILEKWQSIGDDHYASKK